MTRELVITAISVVMIVNAYPSSPTRTFTDRPCGITFEHHRNWHVRRGATIYGDQAEPCSFYVSPNNVRKMIERDDMDLFTISITVRAAGFERGAKESDFVQENGEWYVLGRQGMKTPARAIAGHGWRGLRATAQTGCFRQSGGYAGLCEVPAAFLATEKACADLFGATQAEPVFDSLIRSFRFITPAK